LGKLEQWMKVKRMWKLLQFLHLLKYLSKSLLY
jgi:hypothetical protein